MRLHSETEALIVFAKTPEPGQVKTRLTTKLSNHQAAQLYRAFLEDSLLQYSQLPPTMYLYIEPPVAAFPNLDFEARIRPQAGTTLGARMRNSFDEVLSGRHARAIIIGTDHPTLPSSFIRDAFAKLQNGEEVVLGPTIDGGYYLLGMRRFLPMLFDGMEYSHSRVLHETVDRARRAGVEPAMLPEWYDVDTPSDLKRLVVDLQNGDASVPNTRAVLSNWNEADS